jgi:hypothetical protein
MKDEREGPGNSRRSGERGDQRVSVRYIQISGVKQSGDSRGTSAQPPSVGERGADSLVSEICVTVDGIDKKILVY